MRIEYYEMNLKKAKDDTMLNVIASPSQGYINQSPSPTSKEERKHEVNFLKLLRYSIQKENKQIAFEEENDTLFNIP